MGKFLSALLALAAGIVIGSLAGPAPAAAETIKIAHSTWVGYGPLYIARDKGIFKKNGVDVELVLMEDPKERFPTLMADKIQMISSTVDTALLYLKNRDDFQYVVAIDDFNGGDGIVANKDITSIKDLKGKKVAVNEGSVSEFYLNVLLDRAGLKESELNIVNMTAMDAGTAFVTKRVDAAVTWEPALTKGKTAPHRPSPRRQLVDARAHHRRHHHQVELGQGAPEGRRGDRQVMGRGGRVLRGAPRGIHRDHGQGRGRLAQGPQGVQGDALRHQVLRRGRE